MEALPLDILIAVLCQLDSTKSILSLIQASPRMLQIYHANRNRIFTSTVYNAISPALLPMARTSHKLRCESQQSTSRSATYEHEDWLTGLNLLSKSIEHPTYGPTDSRIPLDEAKQLLRFHAMVDEMIRDAAGKGLALLQSRLSSERLDKDNCDIELSSPEYFRVSRAFYTWEYITPFCRQFIRALYSHSVIASRQYMESFTTFLDSLAFHELEEICFVYNYLLDRLGRVIRQVENDRLKEFINNGPSGYDDDDDDGDNTHYDWETDGAVGSFFSFGSHYFMDDFKRSVLWSESLDVVYNLFNASTPTERLGQIALLYPRIGDDYFSEKLHGRRASVVGTFTSPLLPHNFWSSDSDIRDLIESTNDINLGLLWVWRRLGSSQTIEDCQCLRCLPQPRIKRLDKLVAWGIAIWDSKRLREMGLLTNNDLNIDCDTGFLEKWRGEDGVALDESEWTKTGVEFRAREQEHKWMADGVFSPKRSI